MYLINKLKTQPKKGSFPRDIFADFDTVHYKALI